MVTAGRFAQGMTFDQYVASVGTPENLGREGSFNRARQVTRDGHRMSTAPAPDPREQPSADLVAQFLRRRDGQTFQSIPIAAFFFAFQETPFFRVFACAAVDEIIAMLHERLRVGSLA